MVSEAKLRAYEELAAHCKELIRDIEQGGMGPPGVSPHGGMNDEEWRKRESSRKDALEKLVEKIDKASA